MVTAGTVSSVASDDDFYLEQGGCTIKCDGDQGDMPTVGQYIVVYGKVEVEDDDELELDVQSWNPEGTNPTPPNPSPTVTTVAAALSAAPGTVVEITGNVTNYTDPNDGEGIFTDGTGNIKIDFEGGNNPSTGSQIVVLGTIEFDDGQNEIDVYSWYTEGGTPPNPLPAIAWTASEATAAPDGSIAVIVGNVTNWTNMTDGEGVYNDGSSTINVDFEEGQTLPELSDIITIFGTVDTDDGQKEVEVYFWDSGNQLGITEVNSATSIVLYPVPTSSQLFINTDLNIESIQIYDITGKAIYSLKSSSINMIDISELVSGIYAINLFSNEELIGTKMIVKK